MGLQKGMTCQIVSTKTKDSVSFIIVWINVRGKDEYEILKKMIFFSCMTFVSLVSPIFDK